VFDVSRKRETYGPGGSYSIFAGKDGSRGLGLSSLKPEDAVPDWSTLEPKDRKTLDDWHAFFTCVSPLTLVLPHLFGVGVGVDVHSSSPISCGRAIFFCSISGNVIISSCQ
jgi:hypothetical protein